MKKALVAKVALAGAIGLAAMMASDSANAAYCVACHTMHNSQDGDPMRFDSGNTPLSILLRGTCIYCHTGENVDEAFLDANPPKVISTAGPTYSGLSATGNTGGSNTLAGGDFYWVTSGDAYGHNVNQVPGINGDGQLGNVPPGGADLGAQLECAGALGCHGNRGVTLPLPSLQGAHHAIHNTLANSSTYIDGNTIGGSFRFLDGVLGYEDSYWQFTESTTQHNIYQGDARVSAAGAHNPATISGLCAVCHGDFHNASDGVDNFGISTSNSNLGSATAEWIRHPTDWAMPGTGEYSNYVTYQPETPVGKALGQLGGGAANVTGANNRIVLCVSCHRAHGSPYSDALRWSYATMQVGAGVTNGCMNCHTAK